jgi:uncharacterized damage-inducible protein DinB
LSSQRRDLTNVKRSCFPIVVFLVFAGIAQAQTKSNPLSSDIRRGYESVKKNLVAAAEKVPDEDYGFKPTPEMRSMADVFGHAASAQMRVCSAVAGDRAVTLKMEGKANIVAALKDSSAECDKAFDSLTDSNATEMVKLPRGEATKLGALAGVVTHDTEQYAALSVYMRLKGIVPPSSEHAGRR